MVHMVMIGAGLMGSQIGIEYLSAGHRVTFLARHPEEAERRIAVAMVVAEEAGLPAEMADACWDRLEIVTSLPEVNGQVNLVVESIVEDLSAKIAVLAGAAAAFPHATLASNTSSLSITAIGQGAGAPDRVMGTHYWNPPLLMPVVEVIAGERTDPDRVLGVAALLTALGKRPVQVARDVPGFVWNRLQFALLREALWLASEGVATPEVIDTIVRDGLARRWRMTGPFETASLGGADTFSRICQNLFPHLSTATSAEGLADHLTNDQATLATLRVRRDRELLAERQRDAEAGKIVLPYTPGSPTPDTISPTDRDDLEEQ